jgi:hypothetical protein
MAGGCSLVQSIRARDARDAKKDYKDLPASGF